MTETESAGRRAHLEHPDALPRQHAFPVQGWIVSRTPVQSVIVDGPPPERLELRSRPDVAKAFPSSPHSTGFFGVARAGHIQDGALILRFLFDGGEALERFHLAPESIESLEFRIRKLTRVYSTLACVECRARFPGGGFSPASDSITCTSCGRSYDCSQGCFDLMPEGERDQLALRSDGNISQNDYDPETLAFIHAGRDGLILDCGAGLRPVEYEHVVNLEAVAYRSTDVIGDNEHLPFADETFDGALSLAVLEHVRDPLACAKEICRVLRPGGRLLAVVPLLAPVHAYPHHYYNMTSEGLVSLFSPEIEIVETRVPTSGLPIWALLWILRSWSEGLTGPERSSFLDLRVRDLLGEAPAYLDRDFVVGLSREKNFELASTTLVYGKKK